MKIISLLIIFSWLVGCQAIPEGEQPSPSEENNVPTETDNSELNGEKNIDEAKLELPSTTLQKLDEGDDVLKLIEVLVNIGYTIDEGPTYDETITWAITDFQLQREELLATGIYNEPTKEALEQLLQQEESVKPGEGLPPLAEEVYTDSGTQILGNPYDILAVVNKENALPEDYTPDDLIVPEVRFPFDEDLPQKQLRTSAATALEDLFEAADEEGHQLFAQSGYRSYQRQQGLFHNYSANYGEEAANVFSARPGESEHQTGLSMDITSESVNYELVVEFGDTNEGKWVEENAHHFGFIIRYPEGKEEITEYQYEPWHLRYVGEDVATEIVSGHLTLEEYFSEGI